MFFIMGEVFFLLTRPLMGDPVVFVLFSAKSASRSGFGDLVDSKPVIKNIDTQRGGRMNCMHFRRATRFSV